MANTGYILPQSASSTSETGWADSGGAWITPQNIYGAGEASITDNAFDQNDASHVLRAYNFNLSAIPTGSTINGVLCRIYARSTSTASRIGLVQILDTAGARVGTNMAATPTNVTTSSAAYTWGGSADQWGNSLTESWVKDADFGVGVGMLNGANNADCWIDSVEIDVYYTPPANFSPGVAELTITGFAPTVTATDNKNVSPSTAELVITGLSPTVFASDNKNISPAPAELVITGYAPTVTALSGAEVSPSTAELVITGYAPNVTVAIVPSIENGVYSLELTKDGSPWGHIPASASINVNSLAYSKDGSPWHGYTKYVSTAWTTYSLKAYLAGAWTAKPLKRYVNSTWTEISIKKLI